MKKRLRFNAQGKLVGVDGMLTQTFEDGNGDEDRGERQQLRTSASLSFLRTEHVPVESDSALWNLYDDGKKLAPLRFSNGKTQEDVVNEVVQLIQSGKKIIFIHGVCGTGKSAIALNLARRLGRASIVVPIKSLQRQYEEDYTSKKYVVKQGGMKMKIAMITGRDNHDSVFSPGVSCADPTLPDTISFVEKNRVKIEEYYAQNPLIGTTEMPELKRMKRIAIAPTNPYWSPIVRAEIELRLPDARKRSYKGLCGKEFVFYHRKQGCSYYDQYLAYTDANVIIFNAAKYKIEVALDRKPATDVDIIDECDEFLDSFSTREELDLTRLASALSFLKPEQAETRALVESALELLRLEEKNKQALGVDENRIFPLKETRLEKLLKIFLTSLELEAEIVQDDANYAHDALEVAYSFDGMLADTYVTFRRNEEKHLIASFVTTQLSRRFHELARKTNALVMMSGTLHSKEVLRHVFGISDFAIVEAETLQQGTIEIQRTGKELDCRYENLNSSNEQRARYLEALAACVRSLKKPALIHVGAFKDLPNEYELAAFKLAPLMPREQLLAEQKEDRREQRVAAFKQRKIPLLFTTKCSRGVDFPGDMCNSVVFTKYPNPNVQDIFWKVLQRTHPAYYWEFYRDKARRELLQKIYRAVRSKDDHVYVLSPDIRVLDAVRQMQMSAAGL